MLPLKPVTSATARITTSVCAVLLAEATNTGFELLIRLDNLALRRSRLSWVRQNFLRAETITAANAALVAAQNAVPLARAWGGGEVASADGLRFVVPVRMAMATVRRRARSRLCGNVGRERIAAVSA